MIERVKKMRVWGTIDGTNLLEVPTQCSSIDIDSPPPSPPPLSMRQHRRQQLLRASLHQLPHDASCQVLQAGARHVYGLGHQWRDVLQRGAHRRVLHLAWGKRRVRYALCAVCVVCAVFFMWTE